LIETLRPVFATIPPSAMRMEMTRLVSGRLGLTESLAERLLSDAGGQAEARTARADPGHTRERADRAPGSNGRGGERGGQARASRVLSAREDTERAFIALCIAAPEHGRGALEEVDLQSMFTSELVRRAAEHLRAGRLAEPLRGVDDEDRDLVGLLAELTVEAGRWSIPERRGKPAMLEVQQLQLQLASIDRQIRAASAQGIGEVSDLARLRGEVKLRFDRAQERALAESGE